MERLPPILIEQIFDELSIRDALHASYVSRLWNAILRPYLYSTYNINNYLKDFLPDPAPFLRVLRQTNGILCGPKALAYFLPSLRVKTSDWELRISGRYRGLVHEQLERQQSFRLVTRNRDDLKATVVGLKDDYIFEGPNGKEVKLVMVAFGQDSSWFKPTRSLRIWSNSTAKMNWISGWGAVCPYWDKTFEKSACLLTESKFDPQLEEEEHIANGIRVLGSEDRYGPIES